MSVRERRTALAISLLMGCLVGGYLIGTDSATVVGVILSALALAVPATISVAVDSRIRHRAATMLAVTATSALLGGLLVASAAHPDVWRAYSSDAAWISVLAAMLLAPFAAGFAFGTVSTRAEPDRGWESQARACGVLAWTGVGLQALALPYLFPLARGLFAVLVLHQPVPTSSGGFTYGWVIIIPIALGLIGLYVAGFGFAMLGGLVGGALRTRL